jgi:nucleoside transporter
MDDRAHGRTGAPSALLSGMMFLEYAIRGVWTAYLTNYLLASVSLGGLGFTGGQAGWILLPASAIGAILAPLVGGQLADRYLNAERAMAILLLITGVMLYISGSVRSFGGFFSVTCIASIAYLPTMALTNSIALAHLPDPVRQYPPVRAAGTLGWIVVSSLFTLAWLNGPDQAANTARIADALRLGGVMSVGFAAYCLAIVPRTPPRKDRVHPFAFLRAFQLLRRRNLLVFAIASLLASMLHQTAAVRLSPYLESEAGVPLKWIGPAMAVGQVGELAFLAVLGPAIRRFGYRGVFLIAMAAYVARFALLGSITAPAIVISFQALHGLSFAFIFAAGSLYIEREAPPDARHSSQAMLAMVLWGAAPIAAIFYNQFFDRFTHRRAGQLVQDYHVFWWCQAGIAALTGLLLLTLFRKAPPKRESISTSPV